MTASAQQIRSHLYADAALQHEADQLQRCLETQPLPWRLESTLSTDGRIAETVRITRWGGSSETGCESLMQASNACDSPQALQRLVDLEFIAGEPHPAWSVSERVRLEDLIPSMLKGLSGNVRLRPIDERAMSESHAVLRVRVDYRGATLPRDLNDWVTAPRLVRVTMTLVEDPGRSGRTVASRVLTAGDGLQIRGLYPSTSSSRWMTRILEKASASAQTMIEPLGCAMPWLSVSVNQDKLWLSTRDYSGLQAGREVLLVPTADSTLASRWPIARIRSLSPGGRADLVLLRGSADRCDAGCWAIPL
ncbi:MAG: hypothetical protein FJ196_05575 [Gammaproteobacteria bacterium]|nr:hypothetical protein [Gammaproteobacteria bacterium]